MKPSGSAATVGSGKGRQSVGKPFQLLRALRRSRSK
jgi:hypothetical protein